MQFERITICLALVFAHGAFAAEATEATLPDVEVTGEKIQPLPAPSNWLLVESTLSIRAHPPVILPNCSMASRVSVSMMQAVFPVCRRFTAWPMTASASKWTAWI